MPSRGSKQRRIKEKMTVLRAIRKKKEQNKKKQISEKETIINASEKVIPVENVNLKIISKSIVNNIGESAKSTTYKPALKLHSAVLVKESKKKKNFGNQIKNSLELKKRALKGKITILRQKSSQNEIKPICLDGFGILETASTAAKIKVKVPSQPSRRKDNFSNLDDDFYSNFIKFKNPAGPIKINIKEKSNNLNTKTKKVFETKKVLKGAVKIKTKPQSLPLKKKNNINNINGNAQPNISKSKNPQIEISENIVKNVPNDLLLASKSLKNDFSDTLMPSLEPEINISLSNNEGHEPSTSDPIKSKVLPLIFQRKTTSVIIEPLKAPGENFEIFEARVYLKQLEDELNHSKDCYEKLNEQYRVLLQQKDSFKSALENCARVNECLRNEVKKLKIPLKRNSAHSLSLSRRALYNRFSEIDKIISSPEIEFDTIKTAKKCIERISKRLNCIMSGSEIS